MNYTQLKMEQEAIAMIDYDTEYVMAANEVIKEMGYKRDDFKIFNSLRDKFFNLWVSQKFMSRCPRGNKKGELTRFNKELNNYRDKFLEELRNDKN